tara:strand:- start:172 stop:435 length:264 start_codon:yes stop_codon:yes gene_type:complete
MTDKIQTHMECNFKPYDGEGVRCVNCDKIKPRPTRRNCDASGGLGEKIASITKMIGIKPCGGCQGRREALNRMTAKRRRKKEARDGT